MILAGTFLWRELLNGACATLTFSISITAGTEEPADPRCLCGQEHVELAPLIIRTDRCVLSTEKEQYDRSNPRNSLRNIITPKRGNLSQELSEDRHSPPLLTVNGPVEDKLFRSKSADMELTAEKERIKKMLSEGSICEVNLEAELFTLQDSNAKLVAALHEANTSVEQWKKQLAEYQEETDRLRDQVAELEAQSGRPGPSEIGKDELTQSLRELEVLLKVKDEEIHTLQCKKSDFNDLEKEREEAKQRLQDLKAKNTDLEQQVLAAEKTLASSRAERDRVDSEVQRVIGVLDVKIGDLNDLRQSLTKLINK
ncbi:homer protein homolog 3b isoform X2 [Denticeps clupeoides]|uniref:homer protein homolog 3b isoform X2 n=1 Tax=Denticeps clupeoides TaxID=299321 RepID=UPI0010A42E73|nr:homer protein homolog 3-like isoform X2 [Denticeps clupeoides]